VLFSTCGSEVVQGKRRVYVCIVVSVLVGAVRTCGSEVVQGKRRVYVCIVVSVLAGAVQHVW